MADEGGRATPRVALLGNPNTGKTTLFNRLTGLAQRVANYPGITVQKRSGWMNLEGRKVELVDLPGTYSLSALTPDERVVLDVLTGRIDERPDLVVCVLDATNLKRNLFLVSQAAELGIPAIVVLNQWDEAQRAGIHIDAERLSERLGVPVVPCVATKGRGLPELRAAIRAALEGSPRTLHTIQWPGEAEEAFDGLRRELEALGAHLTRTEVERLLFDNGGAVLDRLSVPRDRAEAAIRTARERLQRLGFNPAAAEAIWHYEHIERLLDGVVSRGTERSRRATDSIDNILLHRFWGSVVFVAVMWVVFQSVYAWATPFMDAIDAATGALQGAVAPLLAKTPMLQSLVVDGAIAGVGGVLVFLPQILILFFFIGLLEDSGYMARAAFLMDRLFGWCGLNGRSFVPLLSSYACAVPGILSARALPDPKARITTVMMAPLMSCSARLPVYVLFIGAFIEPAYGPWVAGWLLFAMHFLGLAVAVPLAWVTNRLLLRTRRQPFLLEMPPYKVPDGRNLFLRMWSGGKEFVVRAGTVILAFSIVIWALLYFPHDPAWEAEVVTPFAAERRIPVEEARAALADEASDLGAALRHRIDAAYIERSYMGRLGKAVQPVFDPAGFDWKITVGVLASFPAREVVVATLGIIYNLGSDVTEEAPSLRQALAAARWTEGPRAGEPVFTIPVVLAIMVFFALCLQCAATVSVIATEIGARWAAAAFVGQSALAWLGTVVTYRMARIVLG